MKYAFFPGCVAKGGCPELYQSVMQVYPQLGIELEQGYPLSMQEGLEVGKAIFGPMLRSTAG